MRETVMDLRVGIHVRGRPGQVVDRPHGSGDYVFIHFLEPAAFGRDGSQPVAADACVVIRPDTPTYIASDETIYNTFVHLSADLVERPLRDYPVPIDRPFAPRATDFVLPLFSRLQREWVQRDRHWTEAVRLCVADLFLRLSRGISEPASHAVSRHADRLREVRLAVHRAPAERWTVARMAKLAHLKESQFSVLYRELFGCPPIEDLIQVRLELAKYYLANHEYSIRDVAELSGFIDLSYFSRRFRTLVGVSPSDFRRRAR